MGEPPGKPEQVVDVMSCDFETLLALADQMPATRFEQIKLARPDFAAWLSQRRQGGTAATGG